MTKHFVEFVFAGSFVSETSAREIKSREESIELPPRAYAFTIYDREEVEHGGEVLVGQPKNRGPRHIVGDVYDMDRVRREVENCEILLSNMKCNDWRRVVKCRQGFVPMEPDDVILPSSKPTNP